MLKKIQHTLLLRYPLLWNMRVVPLLATILILHIIFFICGYCSGNVDFTVYNSDEFDYRYSGTSALFSILASILVVVGWLFFYLRNNAFKSFYPMGKSLFREWLCLVLVCCLNISYMFSYNLGNDYGIQSYMPEKEFARRIDILSMASVFCDNARKDDGRYTVKTKDGETWMQRDWMLYNNKKYSLNSVFNRTLTEYSYQGREKDSLNEIRVKGWLEANRKDSVAWLMKEFEKIVHSHEQEMPLSVNQWLEIAYRYPSHDNKILVAKQYKYKDSDQFISYDPVEPLGNSPADTANTLSYKLKIQNGTDVYFAKYYVPMRQMENAYQKISSSYTAPAASPDMLEILFIIGLMLSVALLAFRVTSGRDWLLALLCFGVAAIASSIIRILADNRLRDTDWPVFLFVWLAIITALFIYFFTRKSHKGKSAIALNIILWLSYWILPALNSAICSLLPKQQVETANGIEFINTGYEQWVQNNDVWVNLVYAAAFIIFMFFFTRSIRRWKGLAEA